ncbi:Six-hairpin glycosidase-like protein [Lipomyces doorenjongii]|uniref:Six-hairpin glycosidase-like protein n=1 Tax=Lipomyces doorenjongii TaxID=383834 RepID=UPI0034D00C20
MTAENKVKLEQNVDYIPPNLDTTLSELYAQNAIAKIWGIALPALALPSPPTRVPDYTTVGTATYEYASYDWWTSGFFPGSLAVLLERAIKYPHCFPSADVNPTRLELATRYWSDGVHSQATRVDTHDLGFMIHSAMQPLYDLTGDKRAFGTLVSAAHALVSRFSDKVGCIRSWDSTVNKRYSFTDASKDYLVIVDNMCNLNMLYWVAQETGDKRLAEIATTHAETTLKNHLMYPNWAFHHLLVYDAETGVVKHKLQHQGYEDNSVWSRGQSWGLLGYAETYGWTRDQKFLDAAINIGEYFLSRLPEDGVPHWDFDAPRPTVRDTSAAMIAANGFLVIYEYTHERKYLDRALYLIRSTITLSLSPKAKFLPDGRVDIGGFDTILMNATINNNEHATRQLADTGLVYADYYFLLAGNRLLKLGVF